MALWSVGLLVVAEHAPSWGKGMAVVTALVALALLPAALLLLHPLFAGALALVGRLLGGAGDRARLARALPWSGAPALLAIPLAIPALALLLANSRPAPEPWWTELLRDLLPYLSGTADVLLFWSWICWTRTLAVVHGFGFLRALATESLGRLLLAGTALSAVVIIVALARS